MFGTELRDRGRWCGLIIAFGLLALCMIFLGGHAVMAGSPPLPIFRSGLPTDVAAHPSDMLAFIQVPYQVQAAPAVASTAAPSAYDPASTQTLPPGVEPQPRLLAGREPWPLPEAIRAGSGAPLFATFAPPARGPAINVPPLAGTAGLVVCLTSERVWGLAGAGQTVTVTVNGQQMGAALTDNQDFFWTTLYDQDGFRPGLSMGDEVSAYHDSLQANVLTLKPITASLDVVTDVVSGTIGDVSAPISVTIYVPWGEPNMASISRTVDSEANGDFVVDFSGLWDLTSEDEATVAYVESGVEVHQHVDAEASLMVRPLWRLVRGFSQPGSSVTVTLYMSDYLTIKESGTVEADPSGGWFARQFGTEFDEGDIVVVEFEGGAVLSRTVDHLTETVDAANDRVTGEAEPGAVVVGIGGELTPLGERSAYVTTTVEAGGVYTLDFGGVADVLPGQWIGVYVPDPEGDDLNLWSFAPSVEVHQTWDSVFGRGPLGSGPAIEGRAVTLTLASTTTVYPAQMNWLGYYEFNDLPDIEPGEVVTVQAEGSPWLGVVPVETMSVEADTAADRFSGEVTSPSARVEMWAQQMIPNDGAWLYPAGGVANLLVTATSPFVAEPPGFDVRNGVGYEAAHRTLEEYAERVYGEADWIKVWPQFNGLEGVLTPPGVAFTVTLLTGGGDEKAQLHGESNWPIGQFDWQHFNNVGQQIETGDRLRVESAAGFSQTVDIVPLALEVDTLNDRFTGSGPANSLLYLQCDNQGRSFVPTNGAGAFAASAGDLQEFWGSGDLEWGDGTWACYINEDGNYLCTFTGWPSIVARYAMDGSANGVFGWSAFHQETIHITVTHPISGVIYTGSTLPGACDGCGPWDYNLNLPDGTIAPGVSVTVDFGGGYVDTVDVVAITGDPDPALERVIGTAPASGILDAWGEHPWGDKVHLDSVEVNASGVYTLDFGSVGWDIQHGDSFHVYYFAPHGHQVEYYFWLPAPKVGVWKWNTSGHARPGGAYVYGFYYENSGNGVATDTLIVDTLPPLTTLADDTSGLPVVASGGTVTWTVGDLNPGENKAFMVTLNIDPVVVTGSQVITSNCAIITTTAPGDHNRDDDASCTGAVDVWDDEVEIGVDKWTDPGDPAPGQEFNYVVQWCNNRGAAAGPVWLTDTLPASTTLLYWQPRNSWERYWVDASPPGGPLVLYAPGLPGNMCQDLILRLLLDPGVVVSSTLQNHAQISGEGDVDSNNNQRWHDFHVSDRRYDMNTQKWYGVGVLVPGGWVRFGANWWNAGNIATHAWLTDSLPVGTSYQPGSGQRHDGQFFDPFVVSDTHVVWDLGVVPVADGHGLDFTLQVTDTFTPGHVLTNCITVGITATEDTPGDNTACTGVTINEPGPNLRVAKYHWWNGDGQLEYRIQFQNVGDQTIEGVWITDVLPADTHWNGWWNLWFDWGRVISEDLASDVLKWQFSELYPGDAGEIGFQIDLDSPGERLRWYTNTVEIDTPEGDRVPEDNYYEDGAFSGGEVDRVEIFITPGGDSSMYGEAEPGLPVTVTTPYTQVVTWTGDGCPQCWTIGNVGPITPGDTIIVEGGHGLVPVVIPIPDPFTAVPDSTGDTVKGQIQGWNSSQLQVHGYWPDGYREVNTDDLGQYTATYSDVPRGAQGHIRYETDITFARVVYHLRFLAEDLLLQVNYGHDWIEGNYAPGHTVYLTVTQSDGTTVKGTATGTTGVIPWWGGQTGLSTNYNVVWVGDRPDIVPDDWVYGRVESNVYTTSVQIGAITGTFEYDENTVSGNVYAGWFDGLLQGGCSVYLENGPGRNFEVDADGGAYACDFDPDWDLQPGQPVGVRYQEPDGDTVINVFEDLTADVQTDKWGQGQPAPGGNYVYHIAVRNQGDAEATNVVLTDTLPAGLTYLTDTSGIAPDLAGSQVTWKLENLGGHVESFFDVFCEVDPGLLPGTRLTNTLYITTTDHDRDPGNNYHEWPVDVVDNDTHLNVGTWAWTGDPAPGQKLVFSVNVCNNGSTASSQVTLTDTIHPPFSLVDWWPQNPGWTEVYSDGHLLVLTYPSFQAGWCSEVYLSVYLADTAQVGDPVSNTATITASNDMEPDDNETTWWGQANNGHTNLYLGKSFSGGQLVPGGELRYNFNYNNNGNLPVAGPLLITDTLPQRTSMVEWRPGGGPQPVLVDQGPGYVVWQFDGLDNGYGGNFELVLHIDDDAPVWTTVLTNTAQLTCVPGEDSCDDNQGIVVESVFPTGPNLRVTKYHWWNGNGQLEYRLRFQNIGTETEYGVWLTDTLPADTHWNGWWNMWFDWGRLVTQSLESPVLQWQFSELYPGDSGDIGFQVDLDHPGERMIWYTNTAEIDIPVGDVDDKDNIYEDGAFSGGEVDRVDLDVHRLRIWGCAYTVPITIETAYDQMVISDGDGCWDVQFTHPFTPGIEVTVSAGEGRLPVTIAIPDPFTANLSSESRQVWGQIDDLDGEPIAVDVWGLPRMYATTDEHGNYVATFDDIPSDAGGDVLYDTRIGYTAVGFHGRMDRLELLLNVHYDKEAVWGSYAPGHTMWITVTEADGSTVKATQELTTWRIPWWGYESGFEAQHVDWLPDHGVDIQPYDWVYGRVDNGQTSTIHLGEISGNVDSAADRITGTIYADDWKAQAVPVWCHPNWGPNQRDEVQADGADEYACRWDPATEWDVLPGQGIEVQYYEPDGDSVYATFYEPAADVASDKYGMGQPAPGGNYVYRIHVHNYGDLEAGGVVLTDTLPGGMTYLEDTSGIVPTQAGNQIIWDLGTLGGHVESFFDVFVEVDEGLSPGVWVTNTVDIATTEYDADLGNNHHEWSTQLAGNDTHLNVNKSAWTNDPAPGYDVVFSLNICNYGSTASSKITLTDTLHISMTVRGWWADLPGWSEESRSDQQLVLSIPSYASGWCSEVFVRAQVDPAAEPGISISNTAAISASNDLENSDNESSWWGNVGGPHTNLSLSKRWSWGELTPGGQIRWWIDYSNTGNVSVTQDILITDTLPAKTQYVEAWLHRRFQDSVLLSPSFGPGYVVWNVGPLGNGLYGSVEVILDIDEDAGPGAVLTNTAEVILLPGEDTDKDNFAMAVEQVYGHGPNLRVRKEGGWHGFGDGHNAWFNITVENVGDEGVDLVEVVDTYPLSMTLDGDPWPDWNQIKDYERNDGEHWFRLVFNNMGPGYRHDFGFNVAIPGGDPVPGGWVLTNTVDIMHASGEPAYDDNQDNAVLTTGPALWLKKDLAGGSVLPGEELKFSLYFGNELPGHEAWWGTQGDVWVTDTLPAALEFITATRESWGYAPFPPDRREGQQLAWNVGQLCASCWDGIVIIARVTDTVQGGDAFTNWAVVASDQPDVDREVNVENNANYVNMVVALPRFEVTKTIDGSGVAGTVVTYTLTVSNSGGADGTGVVLSDTVPASLTGVHGDYDAYDGKDATWSLDIPMGESASGMLGGTLPCTPQTVTNAAYRVVGSDQGIGSANGAPVGLEVVEPTLNAAFDLSDSSVVTGEAVQFTDTSTTNGSAIATWLWDFGDGKSGSNNSMFHTYDTPGTYTVTLTITDTCGYSEQVVEQDAVTVASGCTAPAGLSFSYLPSNPVITFPVSFSATITAGSLPVTYSWAFGDGGTATGETALHTYVTAGPHTVMVTATNDCGAPTYSQQVMVKQRQVHLPVVLRND